jgi:DedD protein
MKKFFLNTATAGFVAVLGLTLLTGCFRKHIESTPPPGATPATRVGPTPATKAEPAPEASPEAAPAPAAEDRTPGVIEETYVVDAPEPENPPKAPVEEADLAAEPAPAKAEASDGAAAPAAKADEAAKVETGVDEDAAVDEAVAEAEADPAAPMGELFYVQVGAFSELENANKVLAGLMEQGYDGSKLAMTDDGRFRVQAGAFTDKEAARRALDKLTQTYAGAFILKGTPE